MIKRTVFWFLVVILLGGAIGQGSQQMRLPGWLTDMQGRKSALVSACTESGLLPTPYCLEVTSKRFREDLVPTEECNIHFKKLFYSVERLKRETERTVYLSPFLIPSLFIDSQIPWDDYREFIDIIVENDYGNSLRAFSAGVWELYTVERMTYPFVKVDGKFDLEQTNQVWLNETLRRIGYFTDRGGVIIYTLIDGCSLYGKREGWWNKHWWNGKNNVNGTERQTRSIQHMFHWSNAAALTTRYYVLKFMDEMVELLEEEFPGSIVYDFNEFEGDTEWYMEVDRRIFQYHNIPKERKMLSFPRQENEKAVYLSEYYTYQAHRIDSLVAYEIEDEIHYNEIMFSADGMAPTEEAMTKRLVYEILKGGNIGFENNRLWWEGVEDIWDRVDWSYAAGMRDGFLDWYKELLE